VLASVSAQTRQMWGQDDDAAARRRAERHMEAPRGSASAAAGRGRRDGVTVRYGGGRRRRAWKRSGGSRWRGAGARQEAADDGRRGEGGRLKPCQSVPASSRAQGCPQAVVKRGEPARGRAEGWPHAAVRRGGRTRPCGGVAARSRAEGWSHAAVRRGGRTQPSGGVTGPGKGALRPHKFGPAGT